MKFAFRSAVYLCILYNLKVFAYNVCKVPNGGAGTCISISKCTPLQILYKKQHKNRLENLFIQQSLCGNSDSPALKVCCPSEKEWSSFKPRPVIFPAPDTVFTFPRSTEATPINETIKPAEAVTDSEILDDNDLNTRILALNKKLNCGIDPSLNYKIILGSVTQIDQYPWLALLEFKSRTKKYLDGCSGSLIHSRFVLTAGHCVPGSLGMPVFVRLAEYDKTTTPVDVAQTERGLDNVTEKRIAVETAFRHPSYSRLDFSNDIGIVKMASDVVFDDFVKAICLPTDNFLPTFDQYTLFKVAVWGIHNDIDIKIKSQINLPYVDLERCQASQAYKITKFQICAGGIEGQDTCKGDSGGPLMYEYLQFYVVGVVSYGPTACGSEDLPAVYTNVYEYRRWIYSVISKN